MQVVICEVAVMNYLRETKKKIKNRGFWHMPISEWRKKNKK